MIMIKHFTWVKDGESGRVAVRVEGDRIEIDQIGGKAPPFGGADVIAWSNEINTAFRGPGGEPLRVWAQNVHATRVNRFAVEKRVGMSGAVDYLLVVEKNAALADYPTAARLHISVCGKLNTALKMWIGDYAALMNAAINEVEDYVPDSDILIKEVPTRMGMDFQTAQAWPTSVERSLAFAALYDE